MNRLQEKFNKEIAKTLGEEFGYSNKMQIPKIQKIVINVGVGKFIKDGKAVDAIAEDLKKISGQAPVKTIARKSIAGFKIREGQVVGITLTLRGTRMYDFLDKLISVALPRVRDFRGVSANAFDGRGNYHLGLKEHLVFPEIPADALERPFGMEISMVINSGRDDVSRRLLKLMDFPFQQD